MHCELSSEGEGFDIYFVEKVFYFDAMFFCRDYEIDLAEIVTFTDGDVDYVLLEGEDKARHTFLYEIDFDDLVGFIV